MGNRECAQIWWNSTSRMVVPGRTARWHNFSLQLDANRQPCSGGGISYEVHPRPPPSPHTCWQWRQALQVFPPLAWCPCLWHTHHVPSGLVSQTSAWTPRLYLEYTCTCTHGKGGNTVRSFVHANLYVFVHSSQSPRERGRRVKVQVI